MVFQACKVVVIELNSLFNENHEVSLNTKYLEKVKKLKSENKVLCLLSQGICSNRDIKITIVKNTGLFDTAIETTEYGELAIMELQNIFNELMIRYKVKQEEIVLITSHKLDKYLSLNIFTVNWDDIL